MCAGTCDARMAKMWGNGREKCYLTRTRIHLLVKQSLTQISTPFEVDFLISRTTRSASTRHTTSSPSLIHHSCTTLLGLLPSSRTSLRHKRWAKKIPTRQLPTNLLLVKLAGRPLTVPHPQHARLPLRPHPQHGHLPLRPHPQHAHLPLRAAQS